MGIPSYFSHLVRNHKACIKELSSNTTDNLFIDANSIIYDSLHTMESNDIVVDEHELINNVFAKICEYIESINPSRLCFIAFDGVAPLAKLKQQRNRRYKSSFEKNIHNKICNTDKIKWNTCAITPGTQFMNKLNNKLKLLFQQRGNKIKVILSGSDVPGEGEHKIFEYIRDLPEYHADTTSVIYGLDADLIMLTLNHLHISSNLYLSRETPHFINHIDDSLEPERLYRLDIPELQNAICERVCKTYNKLSVKDKENIINDYIFLCFMLGNDFLPHFPSLNIRNGGIDILLDTYKEIIMPLKTYLTEGDKLIWKNIKKIVKYLADNERSLIIEEYKQRVNMEKRFFENKTPEQLEKKFLYLPTIARNVEKYINPFEQEWQARYYSKLFDVDYNETNVKNICINYLEGLEWTKTYYHNNCKNWRWCYKYNYPPLLEDILKYIPIFTTEFVQTIPKNPIHPHTQLSYVLPYDSLYLLPNDKQSLVLDNFSHLYKKNLPIQWSFCKYFWESHIIFPNISVDTLESLLCK
tara:strand:- start:1101 stop:2678 length:1578 start_codon:yes stop_codon:yes gene_type:complete